MWLLLTVSMFLAYFFPQLLGHGRYWYLNASLGGSFLLFIVKLILRVIDEYLCGLIDESHLSLSCIVLLYIVNQFSMYLSLVLSKSFAILRDLRLVIMES